MTTALSRQDDNSTDPTGMKAWVTPPGKELRPAEVLAEGEGKTEWAVEEGRILEIM